MYQNLFFRNFPHMAPTLMHRFLARRAHHVGYLRVLCRNETVADDLFQDLAVAILEHAERYHSEVGDFDAWVRGIARNLWRNHARRQKALSPLEAAVEVLVHDVSSEADAHEDEERQRWLTNLRLCLERLPEQGRQVLTWRYHDRLPSLEIAQRLKRNRGAVDTALCRLRGLLLHCLKSNQKAT
jgi:RNA polymerase sigma-70 factor, ECF subfamily